MSDQILRVILEDDGSPADHVAAAPPPFASRAPGPTDREPAAGPRRRKDDEPISAAEGMTKAADMIGRVLGFGATVSAVKELISSFTALYRSVTQASAAHDANAEAVKGSAGRQNPGPREPLSRPRRDPFEPIDAEFEIKGPKPGLVPTGQRAGMGGELIRAPQPLSTRHAATRVETIGVSGPSRDQAVDAQIVGPAGAGAAERAMAALAAAVGPAAIAVGTLTAAVIAGGMAIKRVADGLDAEARRLSRFSAPLSAATATTDIRAELALMRRADSVGPQLARFENRFGRAQVELMELQTELLRVVLEIEEQIAPLTEFLIRSADVTGKNMDLIVKGTVETAKASSSGFKALVDSVTIIAKVAKFFQRKEKGPDENQPDPFMQAFLGNFPVGGGDRLRAERREGFAAEGAP